jgi:hypothetical protein
MLLWNMLAVKIPPVLLWPIAAELLWNPELNCITASASDSPTILIAAMIPTAKREVAMTAMTDSLAI